MEMARHVRRDMEERELALFVWAVNGLERYNRLCEANPDLRERVHGPQRTHLKDERRQRRRGKRRAPTAASRTANAAIAANSKTTRPLDCIVSEGFHAWQLFTLSVKGRRCRDPKNEGAAEARDHPSPLPGHGAEWRAEERVRRHHAHGESSPNKREKIGRLPQPYEMQPDNQSDDRRDEIDAAAFAQKPNRNGDRTYFKSNRSVIYWKPKDASLSRCMLKKERYHKPSGDEHAREDTPHSERARQPCRSYHSPDACE